MHQVLWQRSYITHGFKTRKHLRCILPNTFRPYQFFFRNTHFKKYQSLTEHSLMNTVPENPCVVNGIPDAYSSFWSSPSLDPSGKHINQGPELRLKTGKRMRPFRKTKKRCCLEYQCYPEVCTVTSPGV